MAYEWEDEYAVKAREETAEYFLKKILKPEWEMSHTQNRTDKWDLTVTDGNTTFYTETKIRDIDAEKIKKEGAVIDADKVDFLEKKGKALIIQLFWKNNEVYVWNVAEKNRWQTGEKTVNRDNFSSVKVTKPFYFLPMDDEHVRPLDMSDYAEIFKNNYEKANKNDHTA